jgi:CheY-like chemotaxis protein
MNLEQPSAVMEKYSAKTIFAVFLCRLSLYFARRYSKNAVLKVVRVTPHCSGGIIEMAALGHRINILLADDDEDDCTVFTDALAEILPATNLVCVANGVQLMDRLRGNPHSAALPDILFLDLNMPLKNGFDCLFEIKSNHALKRLPVVIFSTSAQREAVDTAFQGGASLYLKKPDSFLKLKEALKKILVINWQDRPAQPAREHFLIDF